MVNRVADAIQGALLGTGVNVVYQPICNVGPGHAVEWWEALARLDVPGLGSLQPLQIVRTARQRGLLDRLTGHVVDQAFATMTELVGTVGSLRAGRGFTVNFEASQLGRWTPLLDSLVERSRDTGVQVMVEITERDLNAWSPEHTAVAIRLRDAGLALAIDDFGTGYAALGSLFHAPLDTIKIDRSMVTSLDDPRQLLLLERLITTLHELGFTLVVEGVETIDDLASVAELGVEWVQSFLLAKPMSAKALLTWARQNVDSPEFKPLSGWPEPRPHRDDEPTAGLTWRERARRVREGEAALADAATVDSGVQVQSIFDGILHGSFDGVVVCDRVSGEYLEVSDSFCQLSGYSRAELLGRNSVDLGLVDPAGTRRLVEQVGENLQSGVFDNVITRKDRTQRHVEFLHQFLAGDFSLVVIRDVSDQIAERSELQRQASHDHLTGVLNRRGFVEAVLRLMNEPRTDEPPVFLMIADVNRLKEINDELGHDAGDEALQRVAVALVAAAPPTCEIGRWGGDEFAVAGRGSPAETERLVTRLRRELDGLTVGPEPAAQPLTMSVGIAWADGDAATFDALIADADARMYREKRSIDG